LSVFPCSLGSLLIVQDEENIIYLAIFSAIIPLCGDFGFLKIWQMTGAMLIGDPLPI
jgi:hypothetical protein